ncbi:MAG: cysteine desulfurase [Zetaproteobacteria bacterium]|nr:MAG: cysteine desulfurase [Zetaproteobacteria bacterium]
MSLDVAAVKAQFPILDQQVYGKRLVYLDNAATTQKPRAVIHAIQSFYEKDNANVHRGVHALSERATAAYEAAREKVRGLLNACSVREVVFVRGTTEAINLVAQSWGMARLRAGDEILITEMEHHSNIVPWQMLCERTGARLRVLPINDAGELCMEQLPSLLNERTKLVGVVHLSNALGTINPVAEIIRQAHAVGARVLVDGAQAAAHMPIDVQQLDCDFYATSAHKMYGPTGIGVLYAKETLLDEMPPYQGGGDMIRMVTFEHTQYNELPYKFEAGTPNIAGAIGFGAAIDWLRGLDMGEIAAHEQNMLQEATRRAKDLPGLRLVGEAKHRATVLSFTMEGIHPHDLGTILDREGVAIRAGHHCAMPVMQRFGVPATVRASLAAYNTLDDLDALFLALEKACAMFA